MTVYPIPASAVSQATSIMPEREGIDMNIITNELKWILVQELMDVNGCTMLEALQELAKEDVDRGYIEKEGIGKEVIK